MSPLPTQSGGGCPICEEALTVIDGYRELVAGLQKEIVLMREVAEEERREDERLVFVLKVAAVVSAVGSVASIVLWFWR